MGFLSDFWAWIKSLFSDEDEDKVEVTFGASPSVDVICYKLYYEKAPIEVTLQSRSKIVKGTKADLTDLLGSGTWNIGVTAVDKVGNESNFSKYDAIKI